MIKLSLIIKTNSKLMASRRKIGWGTQYKKVICIETNELFYNINDCARKTGLTRQYILHLLETGQACNARILKKYTEELKQKIVYYNSKHFKVLEDEICSESKLN